MSGNIIMLLFFGHLLFIIGGLCQEREFMIILL